MKLFLFFTGIPKHSTTFLSDFKNYEIFSEFIVE